MKPRKLVLKNGLEFVGLGSGQEKVAEVVFHTGMIGYLDIVSNPYYAGKFVCMTYPLIGNYGASDDEFGSKDFHVEGFIVKDIDFIASNMRYMDSMDDFAEANDLPFLCGIDTRMLAKVIRDEGSMLGIITDVETSVIEALEKINAYNPVKGMVKKLSTKRPNMIKANKPKYTVVCLDLGCKNNIIKELSLRKCNVVVLPYNTDATKILSYRPNAVIVSDGPDNPSELEVVVNNLKELVGSLPIAGIGLGHLLVAESCGAKVKKMKFGHHGANQSVKNLITKKILITLQAHNYEVDKESLSNTNLSVSLENLSDSSIEGLYSTKDLIVTSEFDSVDASASPVVKSIYDELIDLMKNSKGGNNNA